eukprot:2505784-Prymnesium_polylepis.1
MARVLRHGAPLLASGGQEFEPEPAPSERPRERLLRQRRVLQERLGLDARLTTVLGAADSMGDLLDEADFEGHGVAERAAAPTSAEDDAAASEVSAQLEGSG